MRNFTFNVNTGGRLHQGNLWVASFSSLIIRSISSISVNRGITSLVPINKVCLVGPSSCLGWRLFPPGGKKWGFSCEKRKVRQTSGGKKRSIFITLRAHTQCQVVSLSFSNHFPLLHLPFCPPFSQSFGLSITFPRTLSIKRTCLPKVGRPEIEEKLPQSERAKEVSGFLREEKEELIKQRSLTFFSISLFKKRPDNRGEATGQPEGANWFFFFFQKRQSKSIHSSRGLPATKC